MPLPHPLAGLYAAARPHLAPRWSTHWPYRAPCAGDREGENICFEVPVTTKHPALYFGRAYGLCKLSYLTGPAPGSRQYQEPAPAPVQRLA